MAQEKPPNVMGDVINNHGIVTQGQIGNNYIIQFKAPTISIIGELPATQNPDGTFTLRLAFRIVSQTPANSLTGLVIKDDVVPPADGMWTASFNVSPRAGGVSMISSGEQGGYVWHRLQAPSAGEYVLNTRVRSADAKPHIQLQVE